MKYVATDKKGNEYNLTEDQVEVWKRCGYTVREEETKEAAKKEAPKREAAKKEE